MLTYLQLDEMGNQVARYLKRFGVGPETRVSLCLDRSLMTLVGILGILKAGGAYVPLDTDYPQARLSFMLEDAKTPVVLTERRFAGKFSTTGAALVCLDTDWAKIAEEDSGALEPTAGPDNAAYVIYTSGSTGKPKGVIVSHRNVVRLFEATRGWFQFNETDVWTLFHSYAFDFSVWEIWGALLHGGKLVIVPYNVSRSPESFYELLCKHRVTVLNQTPSAFRQLIRAEELQGVSPELSLRHVIFGGEALDIRSLAPWFERHGDQSPRLINMYGITETTVHVTYRPVTMADLDLGSSSRIGIPIPDLGVYILDRHLQLVPLGVAGEIFVAGPGVARGYLERPELTSERFIKHLFSAEPGARLYRSGDLGRRLPNGDIEYLGRIDHQVKVRGFRIELREIEAALMEHPDIREALVVVREDTADDQRVVAYLVKSRQQTPTTAELRSFLRERLPDYMVPSAFVFLSAVPLTSNGKVNRKSLPPPDRNRPSLAPIYKLPSNPTEMVLFSIWTQVLKIEQIGVRDDFFALGGHSLLAAQMIARVRERLRIDVSHSSFLLREFLEAPTIAGFAGAIERMREAAPSKRGTGPAGIDFNAEVVLDKSIRFDGVPAEDAQAVDPSAILLTGASGFLGAFLLHELLRRTRADVYCHVRAADEETAWRRIKQNLESYGLWNDSMSDRIIALPGDLSKPLLGLSPDQFAGLSQIIDTVYHNGSFVNFIYPYSAMKAANVGGTQEVIRLASQVRMKPVHYVSSLSVLSGFGAARVKEVDEDTPLDHGHLLFMGYLETKWVAEKLLMLASQRGLPVAIYRPKDIAGHSRTGVWKTDGFLTSVLHTFIELGSAPDIPLPIDYVPVDYVSKAVVHISTQKMPTGNVYHVNQPELRLLNVLTDHLRSVGYPLRRVSGEEWIQELVQFTARNPTSMITPFVPIFTERWTEEKLTHLELHFAGRLPKFNCKNTLEALRGTNIVCPPVEAELLDVYVTYLQRIGFFPPPPQGNRIRLDPATI